MSALDKLAGKVWPEGVTVEAREHHVKGTTQLIFRFANGYGASVVPEYDFSLGLAQAGSPPLVPREGECEIALLGWGDDQGGDQDDFWLLKGEQYVGFEWDQVQRHVPLTDAIRVVERIGMLPTRRRELDDE